MSPIVLEELVDRIRRRADKAAELSIQAAESSDLASPLALGATFWRTIYQEQELLYSVIAGASGEDAHLLVSRAECVLAFRESTARGEAERAALQVVRHEFGLDVASWRGATASA
jgi:hypothetical protein